jgi:hypothetical protein
VNAPTPACVGRSEIYDFLIDARVNDTYYRRATVEARRICGSCPLQQACLVENRDEVWAQAVIGKRVAKSPVTERRVAEQAARDKIRLDGGNLERAVAWIGMTPKGLYSWCRRNGEHDIYRALTASENRKPNQHTKRAA